MNDMTTEKPRKRQFTDEFKADAVQLVVQSDRPIAQVARELEINESSLGYWVKNYRQAHPDPTVAPTPVDAARVARLEQGGTTVSVRAYRRTSSGTQTLSSSRTSWRSSGTP